MERKFQLKFPGFSLVELLVVVCIIGVLAGVGIITYNNYLASSKITVVKNINEQSIRYITAESIKCLIGGKITVMERTGPAEVSCDKDPYVQYTIDQIIGNIMGYVDTNNLFGDNPFDKNDLEGSFMIDESNPNKLGRTNCYFKNGRLRFVSLIKPNELFINENDISI